MKTYKNQYDVASRSGKGKNRTYRVSECFDSLWECECMNWTRTSPRQDCKHILSKKLELQAIGSTVVAAVVQTGVVPMLVPVSGRRFR